MVVRTPPGSPVGTLTEEEMEQMKNEKAPKKGKGWTKFCKHCKVPKPPRTHHCHICGKCVLKMDHHCPWINSCVGHYNHRYFFLFLLYLWIACIYGCITIGLNYIGWLGNSTASRQERDSATGALIFTFVIAAAVFFAMCLFLSWNTWLVISNQTTIEFHYNRSMYHDLRRKGEVYVNIYDVGITRNLRQVFGPFTSYWQVLLPSYTGLPGDGCRWLTVHEPFEDIL
jgi:palmitoyltransferase